MTTDYNKDFAHLTGLERVRHFEEHPDERFGIAKFLAYDIAQIESGAVELHYIPGPEHLNLISTIHGGVLASLLDTAMGCALMTLLDAGERHTIIDLHAKFVRPVTLDAGSLRVIGTIDHRGRRHCTMQGSILASSDKLCASATASAMIL